MIEEEVRLEMLTYEDVAQLNRSHTVTVIPTGSIEQHGPHLPLDTDAFLAGEVALAASRQARANGHVIVTPTVRYGSSEHHMAFPGTLTLQATTFRNQIREVCASVLHHGFRRVLIVNGHGGNTALLANVVQQLGFEHDGRFAFLNYWDAAQEVAEQIRESATGGMGHAGEFETSLMMYLRPEQVREERIRREIVEPLYASQQLDLFMKGPLTAHWKTHELSKSGVMGAPDLANPSKGKQLFEACVEGVRVMIEQVRRAGEGLLDGNPKSRYQSDSG